MRAVSMVVGVVIGFVGMADAAPARVAILVDAVHTDMIVHRFHPLEFGPGDVIATVEGGEYTLTYVVAFTALARGQLKTSAMERVTVTRADGARLTFASGDPGTHAFLVWFYGTAIAEDVRDATPLGSAIEFTPGNRCYSRETLERVRTLPATFWGIATFSAGTRYGYEVFEPGDGGPREFRIYRDRTLAQANFEVLQENVTYADVHGLAERIAARAPSAVAEQLRRAEGRTPEGIRAVLSPHVMLDAEAIAHAIDAFTPRP
ncbi:MAG: hypothetical protein Q7S02_05355 [bacterium]|nr:hypothetical protein [bacterium]